MEKETLLFERNPIPMLIYELDSLRILKANSAAVQKYGYSKKEFEQLVLEDIRPESEIPRLHKIVEDLEAGLNETRVIQHKKKNGELFYVQVNSHTYPYGDHDARMVAILDISDEMEARIKAEKAYRELDHLVKKNPLAMIKWDSKLRILEWSERAEQISGFTRDEMLGKSFFELNFLSDEDRAFIKQRVARTEKDDAPEQIEMKIHNKVGQTIDIRIHTSVLRDSEGTPKTLLTFVEDISANKKVERRLSQQYEMLSFINDLSHAIGDINSYEQALDLALRKICNFIDWPVGHVYERRGNNRFVSSGIWHFADPEGHPSLVEASRRTDFVPGKGFIGEVIKKETPQWRKNVHKGGRFKDGSILRTSFAFPVKVESQVLAVFEFFHEQYIDEIPDLMEMSRTIGAQLGQSLKRIHTREELELNERRYRRLFERANDGIVILKGNKIVDCNSQIEELFGISREHIIGETPFEFSPEEQPDGQKSTLKGQHYIRKTMNGAPQVFDWKHKTHSGEVIDTEVSLNKIKLQDGAYIQGIVRDITEQKKAERALERSEELFRNLFLRAPVAMVMVDQDNSVRMTNRAFEELFGFCEDELIDKDVDEFIVPEGDYETAPKMPGDNIQNKEYIREFTRKTRDNREIDVLVGAIPVYLEGEPLAGFGIYIDISDQKNAQRKLETSLKEKEILLKEIHHRVKNNLAIISALLELQVFNEDDEKITSILSDGLLRIKTMALVHDTLYNTENFVHLKLSNYIDKLIRYNYEATNLQNKEIQIEQDIEDIDLNINQAIPCALILNEFISNAFKYAFENKTNGNLKVRIWQQKQDVHVRVEDDGIGLPSNFEKLRETSMGMTLIDQLTAQLQGNLKISSDGGTTFELVFEKNNESGSSSHFLN